MAITAKLLTDTQLSERLAKVGEGLPDAAAVMVVEWRSRAEALRRHAKVFLGFIVLALVAGIGFVWLADVLVEKGIKAAGKAQNVVLKNRKITEIELLRRRKDDALEQLEVAATKLEERRDKIITAMEVALHGGGSLWFPQDSGTTSHLWEIHFADSRTGWAVGYGGTILHTIDGGKTWTKQVSGTTLNLARGHFADSRTGWVIGYGGTILHTTDGGETWTKQVSSTTLRFVRIHFADFRMGWVVGYGGTILHTTDGGEIWTKQDSGTTLSLVRIHFADSRTGWVVGHGGTILHTTDGGETWKKQVSGTTSHLWQIHFADSRTGWVVGNGGTILRTIDGGKTWTKQDSGTTLNLVRSHFADSRTGWVVGEGGTILATRDYDLKLADLTIYEQIARAKNSPLAGLFTQRRQIADLEAIAKSLVENRETQDSLKVDIKAFTRLGEAAVAPSQPPPRVPPDNTDRKSSASDDTFGEFSMQSSVLRVTTILLIAFLVQILVSLYRYNTRLASYYDARADAVLMTQFAGTEFDNLVELLSPDRFDFGRQPRSPMGNAVELAREILRTGRTRS
jgi:photosystem II stability/assembly factor-like uncharacterized protein